MSDVQKSRLHSVLLMLTPFRDAFVWNRRSRRAEMLLFFLTLLLMLVTIRICIQCVCPPESVETCYMVFSTILSLIWIVSFVSLCVRRLHDVGKSGLWLIAVLIALCLVPYIGALALFVVLPLFPGQKHPNKWGPVPE